MNDLLLTLKQDSEHAVRWFTETQMLANSNKFQTMMSQSSKNVRHFEPITLETNNVQIEASNLLK